MANRSDMKILLKRLVDDRTISDDHADSVEAYSKLFSENIDYDKYKSAAIFVPVEVAISMKKEARNRESFVIIDDDLNEEGSIIPSYTRKFKRIWPFHIYPCQTIDSYGVKMHYIPAFNRSNDG
jgi:hypothetical protein